MFFDSEASMCCSIGVINDGMRVQEKLDIVATVISHRKISNPFESPIQLSCYHRQNQAWVLQKA